MLTLCIRKLNEFIIVSRWKYDASRGLHIDCKTPQLSDSENRQYLLKKKKDEDSDDDNPAAIEAHEVSTKRPRGKTSTSVDTMPRVPLTASKKLKTTTPSKRSLKTSTKVASKTLVVPPIMEPPIMELPIMEPKVPKSILRSDHQNSPKRMISLSESDLQKLIQQSVEAQLKSYKSNSSAVVSETVATNELVLQHEREPFTVKNESINQSFMPPLGSQCNQMAFSSLQMLFQQQQSMFDHMFDTNAQRRVQQHSNNTLNFMTYLSNAMK